MTRIKSATAKMIQSLLESEGPFPTDAQVKQQKGRVDGSDTFKVTCSRNNEVLHLATLASDGTNVWLQEDLRASFPSYNELMVVPPPVVEPELPEDYKRWEDLYLAVQKNSPDLIIGCVDSSDIVIKGSPVHLRVRAKGLRGREWVFDVCLASTERRRKRMNSKLFGLQHRTTIYLLWPPEKSVSDLVAPLVSSVRHRVSDRWNMKK